MTDSHNDRVYSDTITRLRSADRLQRMEVPEVVNLCLVARELKSLLDIGSGSGLFAEAFARAGVAATGVDVNPGMVEAAGKLVPQVEFKVATAEALPFADRAFDATFFGVVFHEVSDYEKALREAARVSTGPAFILEWPHRKQEFGPPLEHRLTEEFIAGMAMAAGYKTCIAHPLSTLILYTLER
jgi:ubiquinone/menaquinone biosynthesis C-methylase UbiE